MKMADNPFLNPDREIVQGKSDEEIQQGWEESRSGEDSGQKAPLGGSVEEVFLLVPGRAFDSLITLSDDYKFLKNGLYVARQKLTIDSYIKNVASGIMDISGRPHGKLLDNITWYEAKRLVKELDCCMLTPAMLWCVSDYLEGSTGETETLDDLMHEGAEWLDGFIDLRIPHEPISTKNNYEICRTGTEITTQITGPSVMHDSGSYAPLPKFRMPGVLGWCTREDIDLHSGLPKKVRKKGSIWFDNKFAPLYMALVRQDQDAEGYGSPGCTYLVCETAGAGAPSRGVRLCKLPDQPEDEPELRGGYLPLPPPEGSIPLPTRGPLAW